MLLSKVTFFSLSQLRPHSQKIPYQPYLTKKLNIYKGFCLMLGKILYLLCQTLE